ncbi:syncoilin [Conger conger]|uniref:syncoilin n=1 Tax=Conger conger TaxID=82655 RepID=UPI002A5AC47F|nr:syncoilin [Conger conger]
MDSGEARLNADPPDGALQEEDEEFDGGCVEAAAQLEVGCIEEADFFEDCMEEFRVQFEECIDKLGAHFKGYTDDTGDEFEDCEEDLATHSTAGVDDLAAEIEACMAQLGIQLEGCAEDSGPQVQGLTEQAWGSKDIMAWSQPVEPLGSWPEEYVEDLGSQLKGRLEEVHAHCEGGVRELGVRFTESIEEVARLEQRRDQLVKELLQLEEPMAQAVQALRAEAGELHRLLARAQLERWNLQEERRQVKRQLFAVARDCTQSRVTLATQQHEVEQFTVIQGELQAQAQLLTEEMAQLREAQQNSLNALRSRLDSLSLERMQGDPSQRRQAPWDLSSYLQDGMKALEEQYEPRLQALLKRKQAAADALLGTRAETQELRARLGPLREEAQRQGLQRTCLEEKITLKRREREERVAQYRDTVDSLEESSRELKTELQIQRKKNEEIQTWNDSLVKELDLYRGSTELCGKLNPPTQGT